MEVLIDLIDWGAEINAVSKSDLSLVHLAVCMHNTAMVARLVQAGVDIRIGTEGG